MNIIDFNSNFSNYFDAEQYPWKLTSNLKDIIEEIIPQLNDDFNICEGIAIHKSVIIENNVTLKRPFIALENCYISANTYFREGVFLDQSVKIGPSTEVKSSIICSHTSIAHLNYIGNSIIGQHVNFEAGSITANHYNEREDKQIIVKVNNNLIETGVTKFGAMVGDYSKIGANAVLSPGTILKKHSIVKRLELIE